MEVRKIVTYKYVVVDNFGEECVFDKEQDALKYQQVIDKEREIIGYIKPKGVTLVVSTDMHVWFKTQPAFVALDGVPFAQCDKEKRCEHFYGLNPFDQYRGIHGGIVDVLKQVFEYTGKWETTYGNKQCSYILHPYHWKEGVLWYNWDGENFTTNDKECKITNNDF